MVSRVDDVMDWDVFCHSYVDSIARPVGEVGTRRQSSRYGKGTVSPRPSSIAGRIHASSFASWKIWEIDGGGFAPCGSVVGKRTSDVCPGQS